jgi:hypothetical protein
MPPAATSAGSFWPKLIFMTSPRLISNALAATTLLSIPAVSDAKTFTFGHRLDHEPSNSAPAHNCKEDGSDDITPACTRVAIDEDGGGAVAAGMTAPANGRITQFRVRAGAPGEITFRVVRLRGLMRLEVPQGDGTLQSRMVAEGKTVGKPVTVQALGKGFEENEIDAVETFPANVKVKKGDRIGIESASTSALYCSHGGDSQLIFNPALGPFFRQSTDTGSCELLVQAVMKKAKPKKH